jgi:hypothetical protein
MRLLSLETLGLAFSEAPKCFDSGQGQMGQGHFSSLAYPIFHRFNDGGSLRKADEALAVATAPVPSAQNVVILMDALGRRIAAERPVAGHFGCHPGTSTDRTFSTTGKSKRSNRHA